ncbi:DUF1499 domain-containing protein [Gymnodinialimonas ulvae]|uniref:DUF1499 domain-containing protein n=1 Tax=Gymnodinialimonas ulvae TaxID=3126504 RepID=UPI00309C3889
MRILLALLVLIGAAVVAGAIYFRAAPLDPAALHVDPAEVTPPATPNFALMVGSAGHFIQAEPEVVATRIAAVADADGAELLAGSVAEGHVTYVVRSRIMGFPDVVSLRWVGQDGGTQLDIFARALYGTSDLGVNTRRAQAWSQAARGATVFSDGD